MKIIWSNKSQEHREEQTKIITADPERGKDSLRKWEDYTVTFYKWDYRIRATQKIN